MTDDHLNYTAFYTTLTDAIREKGPVCSWGDTKRSGAFSGEAIRPAIRAVALQRLHGKVAHRG